MKMNIYKTISVALALMLCWAAAAQNLDPTVEVNRAYEGKLLEIYKPSFEMAVPDTVRQFDLDFDYSVFDNPYKGSYEFKPYELMMKPFSVDRQMPSFWLKAGAGYTLHPDFRFVWTPVKKGRFTMSLYGNYDGYFGEYRKFAPGNSTDGSFRLKHEVTPDGKASYWRRGYRMRTDAGIQGQYDWKRGYASFDLGYIGVAARDTAKTRALNGFDLNFNVVSKPSGDAYFHYDIDLDYSMAADDMSFKKRDVSLIEHNFDFDAEVGAVFAKSHHLLFDLGLQTLAYAREFGVSATEISFTPHYLMKKGRWHLNLGAKIAKIMVPEKSEHYDVKDQVIYPDIVVKFAAAKDALSIYAKAGGGNILNSYTSLLYRNPFTDVDYGRGNSMLDASVERVSFKLGLDGRVSKRFMYDLHAGYASISNGLLDAVVLDGTVPGTYEYLPSVGFASYQKLFVGLDWNWYAKSFAFKGDVEYAAYSGKDAAENVIMPAPLTGDVEVEYNWNRRVIVGADCRFASARKGTMAVIGSNGSGAAAAENPAVTVPGFADLGIYAEYAANNKLSFWLRGGNLLNMTVQYSPLYAEKGINFTAGICLKL